jgi:dTMP kinase
MAFIVIEGLDGSGKSTQVKLLSDYLNSKNIKTQFIHFPTTDSEIFGELISKFLRGELGKLTEVNPYLVALIFAGDRYNLAGRINAWLKQGIHVINDRYVYSNIAYQCAKCSGEKEADELMDWILKLEYEYFKIPKPDLNIFLEVPFSFTKERLTSLRDGDDRNYLKGKTDIHEESLIFQEKVRNIYLKAIKRDSNFIGIKCYNEAGQMFKPEQISKLILSELSNKGII